MPWLLVPDHLPQIAAVDCLATVRAWMEMIGLILGLRAVLLADSRMPKV
ncbi:hypothetical protein [Mesorhizobium sp.]|nr:hypothetical protein [Mesorhizobium sp.]